MNVQNHGKESHKLFLKQCCVGMDIMYGVGRDNVCGCVWERSGCVVQKRTECVGRERGEGIV